MLSQTAEYALRAVLYLADKGEPVGADEISAVLGIPSAYLAKTLHALVRARVLRSLRGRHGGFLLAVAPEDLTLMRVVAPFDRIVERRRCLLGRRTCSDAGACTAHGAWKDTAGRVADFFRTTMIADIHGTPAAPARRPSARARRPA